MISQCRTSSCHSQTFHRSLKTKKQEEAWHALYDESTSHQNPGCIKIKLSGDLDMKNLDTKFSAQASYDCSRIIQSFCKIIIRRRTTKTKLCWHVTIVRVQLWQEWVTNIQKQKRNLMIEVFNSFIEIHDKFSFSQQERQIKMDSIWTANNKEAQGVVKHTAPSS